MTAASATAAGSQNSVSPPAADAAWHRGYGGRARIERRRIITAQPQPVAAWLAGEYAQRAGERPGWAPAPADVQARAAFPVSWDSWLDAERWLRGVGRELRQARVRSAFDETELAERAALAAEHCRRRARGLDKAREFAEGLGVRVPKVRHPAPTAAGVLRRLCSPRWWLRQLRAVFSRRAEAALRDLGRVHRHADPYASDLSCRRRRGQRIRNEAFLRERVASCEQTGEQLELWDVVQRSVANPAVRRAEFMVRIRGLEAIGQEAGHAARFYTLTTPSRFHARLASGAPNPAFAGASPKDGQRYLCQVWARARAKLARLSVAAYGFRIAEPHHDGTPHWHLLLWVPAGQADTLDAVLRGYALADSPGEPGAREHRFTVENICQARGGATAYVAKYVAKNIDGHAVGDDLETLTDARAAVQRVDAWAATHRIRQFQQVGAPPVGLWRELRRIREPVACEPVERARAAADAGDFAGYVRALGGIANFRGAPLAVIRERTGRENEYGEVAPPEVTGVRCGLFIARTREKVWLIAVRGARIAALGPVSITVRAGGAAPGAAAPAWTGAGPPAGWSAGENPCPGGPTT